MPLYIRVRLGIWLTFKRCLRSWDVTVPTKGLSWLARRSVVAVVVPGDAALEPLREDPDASLTVERIADRAEVSPMTVFNLVGNREQLWSAMVDRALEGVDIQSITADDPQERARQIVDAPHSQCGNPRHAGGPLKAVQWA